MRLGRWATCIWPGLPQLWLDGKWTGLGIAIGYASLLNLVLVSTIGWTELLQPELVTASWGALAIFWLASVVTSVRWIALQQSEELPREDLFPRASAKYLQRNWIDAERLLRGMLRRREHDVEAGLMLASVLRRTDRLDEAEHFLEEVARWSGSAAWNYELDFERRRIKVNQSQLFGHSNGLTLHAAPRREGNQRLLDAA